MGIMSNLARVVGRGNLESKAVSLTSPEALALFGVHSTITGLHIGPGTAMRVPAVACAVGLIAETVGTLPVKLFARQGREAMTEHVAYRLAHDEANEWVSAEAFRTQITADALLRASALPAATADVVYSDVLGLGVIAYPPAFGWVVLALAVVLLAFALVVVGRSRKNPVHAGNVNDEWDADRSADRAAVPA